MVSSKVQRVSAKLTLQGECHELEVPVEETLLGAIKTLKGKTMSVMNDLMAKSKEEAQDKAADALLEEPADEIEEEDDEIQRIAGDTLHKKKKRKTGF